MTETAPPQGNATQQRVAVREEQGQRELHDLPREAAPVPRLQQDVLLLPFLPPIPASVRFPRLLNRVLEVQARLAPPGVLPPDRRAPPCVQGGEEHEEGAGVVEAQEERGVEIDHEPETVVGLHLSLVLRAEER